MSQNRLFNSYSYDENIFKQIKWKMEMCLILNSLILLNNLGEFIQKKQNIPLFQMCQRTTLRPACVTPKTLSDIKAVYWRRYAAFE